MKIVVGYHMTSEGRAALDRSIELARQQSAQLHLVRVVPLPKGDESTDDYLRLVAEQTAELQAIADMYITKGLDCRVHVPAGVQKPSDAILSIARVEDASLIVIGMRRRSRVGKLLLGSTAQEVLMASDCDVLSVKPPRAPQNA